jgi:hypothetical protein
MARSLIYTVDASGALTAMQPAEPRSEDFMQHLVGKYPQIISDRDGDLLLIRREQPIADSDVTGGRWSLDHLFVTRGGVPVLVELKRAVDTRLRREVVGQMLDYAANGTAYWRAGRIAEAFAEGRRKEGRDPDAEIAAFIGAETDPGQFWEQVDANFAAGRIKLVFVADTIPRELARIVEFLNEQMRADVRAVELSWFESETGVTALSPRVIGETERAQDAKSARSGLVPITRDEWIEKHIVPLGADKVAAAQIFIEMMDMIGGQSAVTSTQGSVLAEFQTPAGPLYPFGVVYYSRGAIQFNLGYLASRAFKNETDRHGLYDRLVSIVGPLSTTNLRGFPGFPLIKLNDPSVRAAFEEFTRKLVSAATNDSEHD